MTDRPGRRSSNVALGRLAAWLGPAPLWALAVYILFSGVMAAVIGGLASLGVDQSLRSDIWSAVALVLALAAGLAWSDVSAALVRLELIRQGDHPGPPVRRPGES